MKAHNNVISFIQLWDTGNVVKSYNRILTILFESRIVGKSICRVILNGMHRGPTEHVDYCIVTQILSPG